MKLRRQGLATAHVSVVLQSNLFRKQDAQYTPTRGATSVATPDTAKLIAAALAALGAIWRDGYRYKKAGVMLVNLVKANTVGSGLFDERDDSRPWPG